MNITPLTSMNTYNRSHARTNNLEMGIDILISVFK